MNRSSRKLGDLSRLILKLIADEKIDDILSDSSLYKVINGLHRHVLRRTKTQVSHPPLPTREVEKCVICLDAEVNCKLIHDDQSFCLHFCFQCAVNWITTRSGKCPTCCRQCILLAYRGPKPQLLSR